jgi:hypothetical protein
MDLKNNALLLFRNDKKNGESHPDWKGQVNIEGKYYDLALWEKEGAKGKFFSGKVSEPWKKAESEIPPKFDKEAPEDNSDLPF